MKDTESAEVKARLEEFAVKHNLKEMEDTQFFNFMLGSMFDDFTRSHLDGGAMNNFMAQFQEPMPAEIFMIQIATLLEMAAYVAANVIYNDALEKKDEFKAKLKEYFAKRIELMQAISETDKMARN